MSVLSALLGVGLIAVGWSPGQALSPSLSPADGGLWELLGLALLALAVVLGALQLLGWARRR